jgi:ribonuclease VapC
LGSLIFIDTSVIVSILTGEDDARQLAQAIESRSRRLTGAHVRLECVMNIMRILGLSADEADALFDEFLHATSTDVVAVSDETARLAVQAFGRFGKGRGHPAQLNFGDCLSYASARQQGAAILFKGRDFSATDLSIA